MKQIKILTVMLSLVLGVTGTCAFARYFPVPQQPVKASFVAWWGGVYPEYGLQGALVQTEEGAEDAGEEIHVKIRFKYLTFLNGAGGKDE